MRIAKRNLKKQSQFSNTQMSVTSVMTKDYVKRAAFGGRKNKPNLSPRDQSQLAGLRPETRNPEQVCPSLWSLWLMGNEKAKPICRGLNEHKYCSEKGL
jgi:hypothetical protein